MMPESINEAKYIFQHVFCLENLCGKVLGGYKDVRTKDGKHHGLEDYEFWLSLGETNYKGYVLEEPLLWYRKHGRSLITDVGENSRELQQVIRDLHPKLFEGHEKVG